MGSEDHLPHGEAYCNDCGVEYREAKLDIVTEGTGKNALTVRLICQQCKDPETVRNPVPTFFCLRTPGSLLSR